RGSRAPESLRAPSGGRTRRGGVGAAPTRRRRRAPGPVAARPARARGRGAEGGAPPPRPAAAPGPAVRPGPRAPADHRGKRRMTEAQGSGTGTPIDEAVRRDRRARLERVLGAYDLRGRIGEDLDDDLLFALGFGTA